MVQLAVGITDIATVDLDTAGLHQFLVGVLIDLGEFLGRDVPDARSDNLTGGQPQHPGKSAIATGVDPFTVLEKNRRREIVDRYLHLNTVKLGILITTEKPTLPR